MLYQLAADAIVLLHFSFILFVVLGGLLTYKWLCLIWLHLPAMIWGIVITLAGWVCPLTPLENKMRLSAGGSHYSTGFIEHYILPVIYPAGLSRELQISLGIALAVVNLLVYSGLIIKYKKHEQ